MPLTLRVDTSRWRDHVKSYVAETPGVVPVTKGNGYGFGNTVLAAEAAALGVDTLAIGTYDELPAVAGAFAADILVLSPWRPDRDHVEGEDSGRTIHTVSRMADLAAIADTSPPRPVVVEVLTTMRRHGIAIKDVPDAVQLAANTDFRGWALHLPLAGDRLDEARRVAQSIRVAGGPDVPLWASHLSPADARRLRDETAADVRVRVGTALWLGDRVAVRARATVLDVHRLERGERFGYRQRRTRRSGWLLVVAGGTAHGIALEAPTPAATLRQRAVSVAKGGLEATGRALSPFSIAGKQRWFAEPPHMQCSLVWLPVGVTPPSIGDEVDVDVRYTTTNFDEIRWD